MLGSIAKWGTVTFFAVKTISWALLPADIALPLIKVSPQEIFTNQISMLDVNFINPHANSDFQLVPLDGER